MSKPSLNDVAAKIRITKIVTSYSTGADFVSMTAESPEGESFTLEEAQLAEKLLSHEVVSALHLDSLARGTMSKSKFVDLKKKTDDNYEKLIERLSQES